MKHNCITRSPYPRNSGYLDIIPNKTGVKMNDIGFQSDRQVISRTIATNHHINRYDYKQFTKKIGKNSTSVSPQNTLHYTNKEGGLPLPPFNKFLFKK